jgi:hypothetical protein
MGTGDRLPVISETHVVEIAQGPDILQMIDSTLFSMAIRMQSNNFQ